MPSFTMILDRLRHGADLSSADCDAAFTCLLADDLTTDQQAAFLRAFSSRGETVELLATAATVLRRHAVPITCDDPSAIDTCGTGGDGISTFNVSTAAAVVAAGAGVTVAKHGNRSNYRVSGSTDVLSRLGVNVEAAPPTVERCLREAGIGYLNAARLHPAVGRVAAARQLVGGRTIFNLLGPLANPAGVRRQLLGVPRADLTTLMAQVLLRLGCDHALVVHGRDGLCDLTATGPTLVAEARDGTVRQFDIAPEEFGLPRTGLDALRVSSSEQSAAMIETLLRGGDSGARSHLVLNAGAAIHVSGRAATIADGVRLAQEAIDSGAAGERLARWRRLSQEGP